MADAEPKKMGILEHIEELRQRLKICAATLIILFVFFAGFQARTADVGGVSVPYPWPDPIQPFASQFFNLTVTYLKPPFVKTTVLDPATAFIVQFKTAFFLAVIVATPMVSYQLGMFVAPGLREREKRIILRLVTPAVILFGAGVLLAFFVVLPFTFRFLYQVSIGLGVDQPLLDIDKFLDFVLLFAIGFGIAFEVPIIMYALTASGIIRAEFWKKYWRFAIIAIFVFGAVITPDGSGVTMLLISVPMSFLYAGGYVAAVLNERARKSRSPGT